MLKTTARLKTYCIIIDPPKEDDKAIQKYFDTIDDLSSMGYQYFAIIHDKDVDKNGVRKVKHIHMILSNEKRKRVKEILDTLSDLFNCSLEQIQIQACVDLCASVQYLIHKNDKNKKPYNVDEITSNLSRDTIDELMSKDVDCIDLTFDTLETYWISCNFDELELMKKIGLGRYQAYRSTIRDFINLYKTKSLENFDTQLTNSDIIQKS